MRVPLASLLLLSFLTVPISRPAWAEEAASAKPAGDADLPLSKDALFDTAPEPEVAGTGSTEKPGQAEKAAGVEKGTQATEPESKDALFGLEPEAEKAPPTAVAATTRGPAAPVRPTSALTGSLKAELAYTYGDPDHWSKQLGRLELGSQGRSGRGMQWKISGRVDYNTVYDLTDFYQNDVRHDQRAEFQLRETYLDFTGAGLDWRIGRQQIVWGEMVGLFFADVVSAKDMREFILPDFQVLRIPQWAARAEYFKEDFHAEVVWIPFPGVDRIGKPKNFTKPGAGADFYPYPPSLGVPTIRDEVKPGTSLDRGNFGVRLSQLSHGWDVSGFYYTSINSSPSFYRDPADPTTFTPRHDRIWQLGGTLAKDFTDFVLKGEAIYTSGRKYNLVTSLSDADGLVEQDNLDWVVGLDFNPTSDIRVNTQLFQRYFFGHHPDIIPDRTENGATLLVNANLHDNWKVEGLLVHSLNRTDWMFRPKLNWGFRQNWNWTLGADIFKGPPTGLFGQYDAQDRVYTEVRYDF